MMAEDNWGAAEPIRQSVHDLIKTIGTHLGLMSDDKPKQSDIVQQMNKAAMDKSVQDANKSHADALSAQQAAKIRAKAK